MSGIIDQKPISAQNLTEPAIDEKTKELDIGKGLHSIELFNKRPGADLKSVATAFFKSTKSNNEKKNILMKNQKVQNIDLESINISSATCMVLEQINKVITDMKSEIEKIKENIAIQDEEIVDKMKNALHQELTTILQ